LFKIRTIATSGEFGSEEVIQQEEADSMAGVTAVPSSFIEVIIIN
jgi:hypothetical protein